MIERHPDDEIRLPEAPAMPRLTFRHFRGDEDLPGIVAVITAAHRADSADFFPSVAELANDLDHQEHEDPERDLIVAELDGRIVAYARANWAIRDGEYTYVTSGEVDPSLRRRGIGRALLRAEQERLRAVAGGHPDELPKVFHAWIFGGQVGCAALLRSEGYATIRSFSEMARALSEPMPTVGLPDGVVIRPIDPNDQRRIFDAESEAFRDHWGTREWTDADLERMLADPNYEPSLWRVAWAGDEVVGVVATVVLEAENAELGAKRGWLDRISVRRPWRRQGVASALIVSAMAGLRERGLDTAMLGVDAENPTGATRVYEALGFRVVDHGEVLARPLYP